jgi:transcriptional regulator with GAF, ATPase, and Fis domain
MTKKVDVTRAYPLEAPKPRRTASVRFVDAAGQHQQAILTPMILGSAAEAGVVVRDKTISRAHAAFEPRADGLWVKDLGSRNGTYIGDLRVESARIPDGARLRLGGMEITVTYAQTESLPEVWPEGRYGDLVARTAVMRELFSRIADVAMMNFSVLVTGETGTGKELVARALHDHSPAREGPFVVVDCAAMPSALLEAELFGHAKGAFTGANADRAGAIELADGGTVFLDEIGELPLELQPKLLRVLESKTVRRIGESNYRRMNVRFVSATHRDLRGMVAARNFRDDLFFRIAPVSVAIPSLRERRGDIPLLIDHFLSPRTAMDLGQEALALINEHPWPGNVRELRNYCDRVRAFGFSRAKEALEENREMFEASSERPARQISLEMPFKEFRERWIEDGERAYVLKALKEADGNIAAAARAAGVDRTYLFRLVRKYSVG